MAIQLGSAYGKVIIDSSGVSKGTKEAADNIRGMRRAMDDAGKGIQANLSRIAQQERESGRQAQEMGRQMEAAWSRASQKAEALKQDQQDLIDYSTKVGVAFAAIGAAGGASIYSTTKLAARVQTLGVVTATLGHNVGYSETAIRALEQSIKSEGITLQASRQAIAQMIEANVDLANATKLARVAQDAAVISGENSSQTFEKLIYVIASGNTLMARRMGLLVDFQGAYEREAEALGRSAQSLTENEKAQIRVNEVMRLGTNIAGAYENAMDTAGKKVTSLDRHIEESSRILGENWLPQYAAVIDLLTNGLKAWEGASDETHRAGAELLTYVTSISAAEAATLLSLSAVLRLKDGLKALNATVVGGLTPWTAIAAAIAVVTTATINYYAENERLAAGLKDTSKELVDTAKSYDEYISKMNEAAKADGLMINSNGDLVRMHHTRTGVTYELVKANVALDESEFHLQRTEDILNSQREDSIAYLNELYKDLGVGAAAMAWWEQRTQGATTSQEKFNRVQEETKIAMSDLSLIISGQLGRAMDDYANQEADLKDKQQEIVDKMKELTGIPILTRAQALQLGEFKDQSKSVADEIDRLEGKDYLTHKQEGQLEDLKDRQKDLLTKIQALGGGKYLTDDQKQQLEDLRGQLQDNADQMSAEADAFHERTNRILYDIAAQKLAQSGLTSEEQFAVLDEYAKKLGIADTVTTDVVLGYSELIDQSKISGTENLAEAFDYFATAIQKGLDKTRALQTAMDILTGKTHVINVEYKVRGGVPRMQTSEPRETGIGAITTPPDQTPDTGPIDIVPGGQHGLHGIVAPGFPNDSALFAASSGETVDVWPAGQRPQMGGVVYQDNSVEQNFYDEGATALGLAYVEQAWKKRMYANMGWRRE